MRKHLLLALTLLITVSAWGTTVDLSTKKTEGETILLNDKDTLTGTASVCLEIRIASGATVVLSDVSINRDNSLYNTKYSPITCSGDAKIILRGWNYVHNYKGNYPAIRVFANKTLEISESSSRGFLEAISSISGAGAGIGGGYQMSFGNIIINSGNIIAEGKASAGIGGGYQSDGGDITINGGAVKAIGSGSASAIGSGTQGTIGNITIASAVRAISATAGSTAPCSIGRGKDGTSGTVKAGGQNYGTTGVTSSYYAITAPRIYTTYNESTHVLTYQYDGLWAGDNLGNKLIDYYNPAAPAGTSRFMDKYSSITSIVVASSMQNASSFSSAYGMFCGLNTEKNVWLSLLNVTSISGLENLNTSDVTNMSFMFHGLYKVKTLDLSTFDFSKVTTTKSMFQNCPKLEKIYCATKLSSKSTITTSTDMFKNCNSLKGWKGTTYDVNTIDKSYARPDDSSFKGYFSYPKWDGNLANVNSDVYAYSGTEITGTMSNITAGHVIYLLDDTSDPQVTLNNITIKNNDHFNSNVYIFRPFTSATINLKGTNVVRGYGDGAVFNCLSGEELTFQGDGSLEVSAYADAWAAAIGASEDTDCGSLIFKGGTIKATGGKYGAGIGGAYSSDCGTIEFVGGNITAVGGEGAAGIGCGAYGKCGAIYMYGDGTLRVKATKGSGAMHSVGRGGSSSTCGTIYVNFLAGGTYRTEYKNGATVNPFVWSTAIEEAIRLIDAIGTVVYTSECYNRIITANHAYLALETDEQPFVTNFQTLKDANDRYTELRNDYYAAKAVIDMIDKIGEVDYSDANTKLIDDAIEAYNALTDAQKQLVTNLKTLSDARARYGQLAAAVADVISKINAIGVVELTPACKNKIDAARAAYEALETEYQKAAITNYSTLTAAEAYYDYLVKQAEAASDQAKADLVVGLINAIGEVEYTGESKGKIDAARAAYDNLTDGQKALVGSTNLATLTNAEARYEQLKKAAEEAEQERQKAIQDAQMKLIELGDEMTEIAGAASTYGYTDEADQYTQQATDIYNARYTDDLDALNNAITLAEAAIAQAKIDMLAAFKVDMAALLRELLEAEDSEACIAIVNSAILELDQYTWDDALSAADNMSKWVEDFNLLHGNTNAALLAQREAEEQGIEDIRIESAPRKIMMDGTLYIIRDGKVYTATGAVVK